MIEEDFRKDVERKIGEAVDMERERGEGEGEGVGGGEAREGGWGVEG